MEIKIPLAIKSDITEECLLYGKMRIRKISEKEIEFFFGIKNRKLDEKLQLISYSTKKIENPKREGLFHLDNVASYALSNYLDVFSSNYVIDFDTNNPIRDVNFIAKAFKLIFGFSRSGIGIFFDKNRNTNIILPNPYYHSTTISFSTFNKCNLSELVRLYNLIQQAKFDKKSSILIEKYMLAISGLNISKESRFLELMIVLEMLLLPKSNQELSFRFSLRGSKLLHKYLSEDKTIAFNKLNNFYKIRNKIVHEGQSTNLDSQLLIECQQIASIFLKNYLIKKDSFTDGKLDEISINN